MKVLGNFVRSCTHVRYGKNALCEEKDQKFVHLKVDPSN